MLSKAELIFPIDLKGVNTLSRTVRTPLGSEIRNLQDFYLIYLPENDKLGRLRLTTENTKANFNKIFSKVNNAAIYADLKESHPRDFVTWGNFELKEIPQFIYNLYYSTITFSLIFRRLRYSKHGLTVDGNLEGAIRFDDIKNNISYGFRANIGSAIIIVKSENMKKAEKKQKSFQGTMLVLVKLRVSFLEYFPDGKYLERDIDISMELGEYRKIVSSLAAADISHFLCLLFTTSESHWGEHTLNDFTLVLKLYRLDQFSPMLFAALGIPSLGSDGFFKTLYINKKTLNNFFNEITPNREYEQNFNETYCTPFNIIDKGDEFIVELIRPETIANFVRLYCETSDGLQLSKIINYSGNLRVELSELKEKIKKSGSFLDGQLISARALTLLRRALYL